MKQILELKKQQREIRLDGKEILYKMSTFQEPYTCTKSKTNIELDLSTYATKSGLKMQQVLIHQIQLA